MSGSPLTGDGGHTVPGKGVLRNADESIVPCAVFGDPTQPQVITFFGVAEVMEFRFPVGVDAAENPPTF